MEIWDWFTENEKLMSGLAAALVILGAVAAVGRNFFLQIIINYFIFFTTTSYNTFH